MSHYQSLYHASIIFLVCIVFSIMACEKEYSYEQQQQQNPADTAIPQDILPPLDIVIPACPSCNNPDTSATYWNFNSGNTILCGAITGAVKNPDDDAMTFFGPSACSIDTGLIITAFFNKQDLKLKQTNITAVRSSLEYYDNTTHITIFRSRPAYNFTVTITQIDQQTGWASGTFSGRVEDKNRQEVKINNGSFRIKF